MHSDIGRVFSEFANRSVVLGLLVAAALTGCDGQPEVEPSFVPLVDPTGWRMTEERSDPLADHRPARVECPASAWRPEGQGVELSTGTCNYFSLSQPAMEDVERGDTLHIMAWWNPLVSVEPAEGHLAVILDGQVLWEELVAIPSAGAVRDVEITSPVAAEAGSTVTLHLHNHGFNSWQFRDLSVLQ